MKKIIGLIFAGVVSVVAVTGCAVTRDQETVGAYLDDSGITTAVKAKFVEDKTVDASSISVETLKGEVVLSGFAKSAAESEQAEKIAKSVKGVTRVQNKLVIRK